MQSTNHATKQCVFFEKWLRLALLLALAALFLRYQYILLEYLHWGDETETIVAVKMIAAGETLYKDIFNHHGPFVFLPGLIFESIGDMAIRDYRLIVAGLQILSLLAVFFSPMFKDKTVAALACAAIAVIMIVYLPDIFGHMYKYQVFAGLFILIGLSLYVLPSIAGVHVKAGPAVFVGSFLIFCLPFIAVTYLPATLLFTLASYRKRLLRTILLSLVICLVVNILFLSLYASFQGYAAFHYYLNSQILPSYSGASSLLQLVINVISNSTSRLVSFVTLVSLTAGLVFANPKNSLPSLLRKSFVLAGILSLCMRGAGWDFHTVTYYYAALSIVVLALSHVRYDSNMMIIFHAFMVSFVLKASLIENSQKQELLENTIIKTSDFSEFVKVFTTPSDSIISYSFNTHEYLLSERLPSSGYYFYLPWQAEYNLKPKFGVLIDPCKDISEQLPKVIQLDQWTVWDKYKWSSYGGCVQQLVDKNYLSVSGTNFYLREDVYIGRPLYHDYPRVMSHAYESGLMRVKNIGDLPRRLSSVLHEYESQLRVESMLDTPSLSHDVKPIGSRFKVQGKDPFLVFKSIQPPPNFLGFNFELSGASKVSSTGQIFWKTEDSDFNEIDSIRFDLQAGNITLPLRGIVPGDKKSWYFRVDFEGLDEHEVAISDIKLIYTDEHKD